MKTLILGLNAFHGDSAAVSFVDGRFVCGVEEERLNRIKHWAGFPRSCSTRIEFSATWRTTTSQDRSLAP